MRISKTQQAAQWFLNAPGRTQADASRKFGVAATSISSTARIIKASERNMCPGCGYDVKISKTAKAVSWLRADPSRTQVQASKLFDVTQPAISLTMRLSKPDDDRPAVNEQLCPVCGQISFKPEWHAAMGDPAFVAPVRPVAPVPGFVPVTSFVPVTVSQPAAPAPTINPEVARFLAERDAVLNAPVKYHDAK